MPKLHNIEIFIIESYVDIVRPGVCKHLHSPVSSRSLLLLVVLLGSVELGSSLLTGTISGPTGNYVTRGMIEDDSPDAIGTFVMCGIHGEIPYDAL
jgi:hypothetical protein